MTKLFLIFRTFPTLLLVYGLLQTIANIAELRATAAGAGMDASLMTEMRVIYLTGLMRSFGDLFHYWALAALVGAGNTYLARELGAND
ncbi:hypothetical protein OU426_11750 [Frigidibacter sp. RF13]|uniref:hypothetical protein n=1 Tax=Frigidibacter sp. RF13 TaxID=2997340 RepID=UPI00227000A8|nr:hypothetical protein [Frigidibacter sp. RF13]MCY1127531.1 hypothetical protein [Frigidibacter sp. RF13]